MKNLSVELQANIVIVLEKMFGVSKTERPKGLADATVGITLPELNINIELPCWRLGVNRSDGIIYFVVAFGVYFIKGTATQIKNCWLYTRLLEERLKQPEEKKIIVAEGANEKE